MGNQLITPDSETLARQKISKRPEVQNRVEKERRKLHERFPQADPLLLSSQARDKTAAQLAIDRVRDELKTAKEDAMTDGLTQLPNRKWVEKELTMRVAEANRKKRPFRIMMLDFDHFKWVNDGWGHRVGDSILQIAKQLHTRSEEPFGRWGGEEFLQILENGTDLEGLAPIVSRHSAIVEECSAAILQAKEYSAEKDPAHKMDKVTLSIGIANFLPGMDIQDVIEAADKALYEAKKTRNTAVFAMPNPNPVSPEDRFTFQQIPKISASPFV